ncbi:hypothetical protein O9G_000195 [Rozella allomycis CSF55]|uniref:Uncharacterized protein n=1 Tax=Rozella allomycis (strain CSF55) TaxID=988480 RepID=A0A075ASM8_ROZAC|nr:hypothetical protein O9G_000195 [Rozella allomycis CSF55]|eukprot:EPZ31716.1 hypothetical protein O9G_000195 [Rozella allomycis CSF55]
MDKSKGSLLTPMKESESWSKLLKGYAISNPIIIMTSEETFVKMNRNIPSYNQYVVARVSTGSERHFTDQHSDQGD